jgi:Cu2+-containing amine oxidase
LQAAIKERETELLEELMTNKKENLQTVDKIHENYVELKQNNVKQITNYKKMTSALQDDDELMEQFVKDSTPKLEALSTSLTTTFPLPLTNFSNVRIAIYTKQISFPIACRLKYIKI